MFRCIWNPKLGLRILLDYLECHQISAPLIFTQCESIYTANLQTESETPCFACLYVSLWPNSSVANFNNFHISASFSLDFGVRRSLREGENSRIDTPKRLMGQFASPFCANFSTSVAASNH